jgi:hypothetical protein
MPLGHSIVLLIVAMLSVYVPSFVGSPVIAGAAVMPFNATSSASIVDDRDCRFMLELLYDEKRDSKEELVDLLRFASYILSYQSKRRPDLTSFCGDHSALKSTKVII